METENTLSAPNDKKDSLNIVIYILVAILILIVIGLGGYFIWDYYQDNSVDSTQKTDEQLLETNNTENNDTTMEESETSEDTVVEETEETVDTNLVSTSSWKSFSFDSSIGSDSINTHTFAPNSTWTEYGLNQTVIPVSVSFKYPSSWVSNSNGVDFNNPTSQKILLFSPPGIAVLGSSECFEGKPQSGTTMLSEYTLISEDQFTLNGVSGIVRKEDVSYSGSGRAYVYDYCVKTNSNAFIMQFVDWSLDSSDDNKNIFDTVVSTMIFE